MPREVSKGGVVLGAGIAVLLLVALPGAGVLAGEVRIPEEYSKQITSAEAVGALGADLFGEQVNLYTGATTFVATDVSLRGNHPLPVAVGRRFVAEVNVNVELLSRDGGFADWELDIPHLHGTFAKKQGWLSDGVVLTQRCSAPIAPPTAIGRSLRYGEGSPDAEFIAGDFWSGNFLYVPGVGDQEMLQARSQRPGDGVAYPWVTHELWQFSCLPGTANGVAGEGFVALSPEGVRYRFDWIVQRRAPTVRKSPLSPALGFSGSAASGSGAVGPQGPIDSDVLLERVEVWILPTRVEDRFGNVVTYTYDSANPWRLTQIAASDGRALSLQYDAAGHISTISDATRTWRYAYTGGALSGVTLPDQSRWTIDFAGLRSMSAPLSAVHAGCPWTNLLNATSPSPDSFSGTLTHPSGAVGVFRFRGMSHGRSYLPRTGNCNGAGTYVIRPYIFRMVSLDSKTISGAGLASLQWNWTYGPTNSSWLENCPNDSCPSTKTVSVTGPDNTFTRYTFGNRYKQSEGKLLKTELGSPTTILRTTTSSYQWSPAGQPYPALIGASLNARGDGSGELHQPLLQSVTSEDGATFTASVTGYDDLARALSVRHSSSLGFSRSESIGYYDDRTRWVLGQISRRTNVETGLVMEQTDYDATTALPRRQYAFGKLLHSLDYAPDGTLSRLTDGRALTTVFSNWKRGIPQSVLYPDGKSESVAVNGAGWITSLTDENGFLTAYSYDLLGRLTGIDYPIGDSVAWNRTSRTFAASPSAKYGLPAGHWQQSVTTGDARTITYYDALWRPRVTERFDAVNPGGTASAVVQRFNGAGQVVYQSYPLRTAALSASGAYAGSTFTYDTLGRPTSHLDDSERGVLTTKTEYLTGLKKRITTAGGAVTLITYQAYDQPLRDWPRTLSHPAGEFTEITRDVFGKTVQLRRRNASGSESALRKYVYDANQQLCKRIEPETGSTVLAYDPAGNLQWSAAGLTLPDAGSCNTAEAYASGRRVERTYDERQRLKTLAFPDGVGNQFWSYTPDGLPEQILTHNTANGTPVTNQYRYNKRRLLESESHDHAATVTTFGYGYDANGYLASLNYPGGLAIGYAPNALGQPTRAGSYASNVSFHPNGDLAQFTYGNGLTHAMTQNARQLPARSTDSGGALDQQFTYDNDARLTTIEDFARGPAYHRVMTYDKSSRLLSASSPAFGGDGLLRYTYDALDNLRTASLGGVRNHRYDYDAANRLSQVVDAGSGAAVSGFSYDVQGNLASKNGLAHRFDVGNRLREVVGKERYRYDGQGRRVAALLADGRLKQWRYSAAGQMLQEIDPLGNPMQHIYLGNRLLAKVGADPSAPIPLPAPGGLQATPSPASGSFTAGWSALAGAARYAFSATNGLSNLSQSPTGISATVNDPDGGSWSLQVRGCRDTTEASCGTSAALSVGVTPKPVGNVNVPAGTQTGAYSVSWPPSVGASQYRAEENRNGAWLLLGTMSPLSFQVVPTASGTYRYRITALNAYGERAGVESASVTVTLPGSGTLPAPSVSVAPNPSTDGNYRLSWSAVSGAVQYQVQEQPSAQLWSTAALLLDFSNRPSGSYSYTVRACATTAECSGTVSTSVTEQVNRPIPPPPVPANLQASPATGVSDGTTVRFSWSSSAGATYYEARIQGGCLTAPELRTMAEVTPSPAVRFARQFRYCGSGSYSVDVRACHASACSGWSIDLSVDVDPPGPALAAAPSVAAAASSVITRYYHTDSLGSPVALSNEAGQVIERVAYDPWGVPLGATVNGMGYTGHVMDASTSLTYMQQRYYDPAIGRFLSIDPLPPDRNTGEDFNLYAYVRNDPLNKTDPTGTESACVSYNNCANVVVTERGANLIGDLMPIVGDIKGAVEAIQNPSVANVAAAVVGIVSGVGDVAGRAIKGADELITMDKAVELGADHVKNAGDMITTGKGTNYQFTNSANEAGDTVTRNARFDVNPADSHVQKQGAHLNLETQVNGRTVQNDHIPIDPATVRPGDTPPPREDL